MSPRRSRPPMSQGYLQAVFVLIGAALALAVGVADFTLLALAAAAGTPTWALVVAGAVLVGGPLCLGLVPAVRPVEGVAVQTLLAVRFPDGLPGPAASWRQRVRTEGWYLVHLGSGALVVAAVLGLVALGAGWWTVPAAAATLVGILVLGRALARLGPVLLGPSYAERFQRLEADAARAAERNRIAREIHDSIGHALTLVTVQASAARRLIGRDPGYAEDALGTIETTSRRAVAELDHVLGLLREDSQRPAGTAPAPDLGAFDDLLDAARSAGLRVESTVSGDLTRLPALVSQEAYRMVQEGVTNALKYSSDGSATLGLSLGEEGLELRVSNPTRDRRSARPGRGLRGVDERATALGGTARAGERGGRWTLCVVLPVPEAQR